MGKLDRATLDEQLAAQGEADIPMTFVQVAGPNGEIQLAPAAALPPMRDLGREPDNFTNREFLEQFGITPGTVVGTRQPLQRQRLTIVPSMPVLGKGRGLTRDDVLKFMGIKKEGPNEEGSPAVAGAGVAGSSQHALPPTESRVRDELQSVGRREHTHAPVADSPGDVPAAANTGDVNVNNLARADQQSPTSAVAAPSTVGVPDGVPRPEPAVRVAATAGGENAPVVLGRADGESLLVRTDPGSPRLQYLGGPAGTGKTFAIRVAAETDPGLILCATTGIAACNLGESVTTINSLLFYFDLESLQENWTSGLLERRLMMLAAAGCRRIVLDEVSMMDGRQLAVILAALELVNELLERDSKPPITLTLTGDFLQLPPIDAEPKRIERRTGRVKGGGCFAFEVPQWPQFETTILTNIRRQADPQFIMALREARRGHGAGAAEILARSGCLTPGDNKDFNGTTLLAKNDAVDRFNMMRLLQLPGPDVTFKPDLWGKSRQEWKNIPGGHDKSSERELVLRKGALVMILANLAKRSAGLEEDGYEYVNGDLGIFEDVVYDRTPEKNRVEGYALVKLQRTGKIVTVGNVTRQNKEPVTNERMRWLRANAPDKIDKNYEIIGELEYMPLRAAWASTVHKAQGLSLDSVQVDLRDGFFRTPGMAYVALTRCRSMEGLKIVGNAALLAARCNVDSRVRRWL